MRHILKLTAIALLAEGYSVSQVADRVGYATPSAFVAAFRRVTGHTPAAYFAHVAADRPALAVVETPADLEERLVADG